MKFVFAPTKHGYSEELQDINLKFAPANEKDGVVTELSSPFICRDFFNEAMYATENKCSASIYGYEFNGKEKGWDKDRCRITLTFDNQKHKMYFLNNLSHIHDIESRGHLFYTEIMDTGKDNKMYLVGDSVWRSTAYMVSLYTLLHRIMCHNFKSRNWQDEMLLVGDKDSGYWQDIYKKAHVYLTDISKFFSDKYGMFGVDSDKMSTIHNYTGIVSVMGEGSDNKYFKYFDDVLK